VSEPSGAEEPVLDATSAGTVNFGEWQTGYRTTGDLESGVARVVVAHGGPGATHDYVLTIADIARSRRPVIHYDQIGNGRSTHLRDRGANFWTVDLFLDELDNLLDGLGISDAYHLLGQSWGGMLGAEHAIRQPSGLRSLTLSDSPASMPLWLNAAAELRSQLPPDVQQTLTQQLPRFLAHVHPTRQVPERALLLVSAVSLILGLFFVGQVGLLSSLVNFGALFSFLMLHVSVVVYFVVKNRARTFGLHLLSPLIGFAIIAYVLVNADVHAKIGGLVWLGIGVVILIGLQLAGRSTVLSLEAS